MVPVPTVALRLRSQKGLTKLLETGAVPNPAFVALGKLSAAITDKVATAVTSAGGTSAIAGWTKPMREPFTALASSCIVAFVRASA